VGERVCCLLVLDPVTFTVCTGLIFFFKECKTTSCPVLAALSLQIKNKLKNQTANTSQHRSCPELAVLYLEFRVQGVGRRV